MVLTTDTTPTDAVTPDQKGATETPAGTTYVAPGRPGSIVDVLPRYDNFIGGHWVAPVNGRYMPNVSPVDGQPFCEVARSSAADIELALDAAHAAKDSWVKHR